MPITPDMAVYPGNTTTRFEPLKSASGTSFLTAITMSSHAGTHIDAPSHVTEGGKPIESFYLERFYGPARVLDMAHCRELVTKDDLQSCNIKANERILLKTQNSLRGFETFHETWVALSSEGASYLSAIGVSLVGIDWFGIKQKNAPDNLAHTALLDRGIPILEGINLSAVEPGDYTLNAFPLAMRGIDGAPARAVLISS